VRDPLDKLMDQIMSGVGYGSLDLGAVLEDTIAHRTAAGKELAAKFPELKGLSFEEFVYRLPMDLDFITASEMYDAINEKPADK
jgi:hypothetical protein